MIHSGTFTIKNETTSEYRTFKVKKVQTNDFMTGKRLVGLLTGPDNFADFKLFGYVNDDTDRVVVFKKHTSLERPTAFQWYAHMINVLVAGEPDDGKLSGYSVMESRECRRCGRTLTTPESITNGIGPECAQKGL